MQEAPIKVLMVDDDEDDFVIVRDLPARRRRRGATSSRGVSDYANGVRQACQGTFDVVLVDYRLGALDGIRFVREVVGPRLQGAGHPASQVRAAARLTSPRWKPAPPIS
jgi:CheY-like chemotaxis protein